MINNVVLVGRLTKDPVLRKAGESSVCAFTLAVDRSFKNSEGEREADFIPVLAWGKLGETCAEYLKKGRLAGITGRLQVRYWEDDAAQRRFAAEVVADDVRFLDKAKEE